MNKNWRKVVVNINLNITAFMNDILAKSIYRNMNGVHVIIRTKMNEKMLVLKEANINVNLNVNI